MLNSNEFQDELFGNPKKFLMDPVHGAITFFTHEGRVIDHALFQRLRFISQTDITSFVFPGATHTRFQHSLGTMHVAGRLFQSIIRSYLLDARSTREHPITKLQINSIQYFYSCLRLAALMHDLGHFPFSHQFEDSIIAKNLLNSDDAFEKLWMGHDWRLYYNNAPTKLEHEYYSVRCAYRILDDLINDKSCEWIGIEAIDVLGIMEKTDNCKPSEKFVIATIDLYINHDNYF